MVSCSPDKQTSLPATYPYRCYAVLKGSGRYTGWRFDLAGREEAYRHAARKANGVALASAQRFPAVPGQTCALPWKTRANRPGAEEFFRGANALPIWSPLYLDIDCSDDPEKALAFTRTAVKWFRKALALPEGDARVWFSGSKGFHVIVNPLALGIKPAVDLTRRYMRLVAIRLQRELVRQGEPRLEPDLSAYSLPRLLRLPNEVNPKSGLYKIELRHEELASFTLAEIRDLANAPRDHECPSESTAPIEKAATWWRDECRRIDEELVFRKRTAAVAGVDFDSESFTGDTLTSGDTPDCVRKILTARAPPGMRNRLELQLVCWARASGKSEGRSGHMLAHWSARNRPGKPSEIAARETQSVVRTVWSRGYAFSCLAMRNALRGIGLEPDCETCTKVTRKGTRTVSALRVNRIEPRFNHHLSLEEAHERLYRHARTACRN